MGTSFNSDKFENFSSIGPSIMRILPFPFFTLKNVANKARNKQKNISAILLLFSLPNRYVNSQILKKKNLIADCPTIKVSQNSAVFLEVQW